MIVKKGFNYLINFNLKKGFFRLDILAMPIWIILSWKMRVDILKAGYRVKDLDLLELGD